MIPTASNATLGFRNVTIVGFGPSWDRHKPLPAGESWGLNTWPPKALPTAPCPFNRFFQVHPVSVLNTKEATWLRACPVPIYVLKLTGLNLNERVYPREKIPEGPLTSSFDYMLALAITEGFESITLIGVDFQHADTIRERVMEHVGLAYWIGLAKGRSIIVDNRSDALKFPWRYGLDYWNERRFGQRLAREAVKLRRMDDGQAKPGHRKGVVDSGRLRG